MDNSAWARFPSKMLSRGRRSELVEAAESRELAICLPFLLEAGYSAQSHADHDTMLARLLALPYYEIDEVIERRAIDAQRQLARAGHHRLPPIDLMIAAIAERHSLGVLHYDADYDLILERSDVRFESVWLAQRGSL